MLEIDAMNVNANGYLIDMVGEVSEKLPWVIFMTWVDFTTQMNSVHGNKVSS